MDEALIAELEDHLKDILDQKEKTIQISDTPMGNIGAVCVAAVLTMCDCLTEVRMSNCGIKDEGAINLF